MRPPFSGSIVGAPARGYGNMDNPTGWYEAEVLTVDLTAHHHTLLGTCGEEIEARVRLLYPRASTVLVRSGKGAGHRPPDPRDDPDGDYLLLASFLPGSPNDRP